MKLPFTPEQFFDVFRQYNESVWPMQVGLTALAIGCLVLLVWHSRLGDRIIAGILAALWLWAGVGYQLVFFAPINPAAYGFAAVFVAGAVAFSWFGVMRGGLTFAGASFAARVAGAGLIGYALIVYPVLSSLGGHGYPTMPTFGLPCPTTLFTVGLLCFAATPLPWAVMIAPLAWSLVGLQAALLLGVHADLGLMAAAVIAIILLLAGRTRHPHPA